MRRNLNKIKFLSHDEITRLIKVIESRRDRALFLVAYRHGLRASEVGLLQTDDIDLTNSRITIRRLKGSMPGVHRLEADEQRAIRAYLRIGACQSGNPLFPGYKGKAISRRMLDVLMKRYCKLANIPQEKAHFHSLKHSIATHLIEARMGIEAVRDWLGHTNIENTMIYARISNQAVNAAAAVALGRMPKF